MKKFEFCTQVKQAEKDKCLEDRADLKNVRWECTYSSRSGTARSLGERRGGSADFGQLVLGCITGDFCKTIKSSFSAFFEIYTI